MSALADAAADLPDADDAPKPADTPAKAPESAADGQSEPARDFTAEAKAQGWTPETEYHGKRPWVDAETFVRRGEELAPFLQANNKALEKALKERDAELKAIRKTLEEFGEHHSKTEERAYKRVLAELTTRQAEAVENNDVTAVRAITEEISDLKAEAKAAPKVQPADPNADFNAAYGPWLEANAWFETDKAMKAYATTLYGDFAEHVPPDRRLAEITKAVKAEFPHKFTNPNRDLPGTVEGAPNGGRPPRGKSYSDLPPEAKAICDDFVKSIKGFTRERYVKDYFA